MGKRYIINGKFLMAGPTGVHRVAAELANAIADLAAERHPATAGLDFTVRYPREGAERAKDLRMGGRVLPFLTHIPWEQITLPLARGRGTLLNLCNIGPAFARDSITMIHDAQVYLSPESYSRAFRLWYRLVQTRLARRNRLILTVSDYSRGQIAAAGLCSADRIVTIPNGADHVLSVASDPAIIDRRNLGAQPFALALATTQAHKNIAVLLRAFARPDLADTTLLLFGSGSAEDFARAGLPLSPNVRFAGRVSDGELRALMESAVALLFPSTTEGFGLPPLEAMALGCPTIVAPCGALPEVCGDAALYAAPDDADEWADQLKQVIANQDLKQVLIDKGRDQASRFTWRNSALKLLEVLQ